MPRPKTFDQETALRKATDLFWEKGYSATSIQDLVDHVGINRGSLYETFGGKKAFFLLALNTYRAEGFENIQTFLANYPQVKEGFLALFDRAIGNAFLEPTKKGCFVVNTTAELLPGDPEITKILEDNKIQYQRLFQDYIQKGIESGQISPEKDAASIARMIFMLYNGMMVVGKMNSDQEMIRETVQTALSVLD